MARFGFGLGGTRHTTGGVPNALVQQITASGVTFSFTASRPAGQYANGDWWVLGPVTITAITPASTTMDGTRNDGSTYTGRAIHGTMMNPGNPSFATGDAQGFDSFTGSTAYVGYLAANNVDPGRTGSPLVVTTGSVVKCLSATAPAQLSPIGRQAPLRFVVLTVVDAIPAADAIRPGMTGNSKATQVHVRDFDLSVFQNLAPIAGAPTFAEALANLAGPFNTFHHDSINSANMMPQTSADYGREIANRIHPVLLAMHTSSYTAEQKRTLLIHLMTFASDLVSRVDMGALAFASGGGNQWKKPALVVATAALGSNAPANWVTACDGTRIPNPADPKQVWAEDAHFSAITDYDIALARITADGRPRTPFTYMALGSVEWGNWYTRADSGMNWDTLFYRLVYNPALIGGMQAVEMTSGGVALWNNPQPFIFMKTLWHRRDAPLVDVTNRIQPYPRAFMEAYRFVDPAAPQIVAAQVKGGNWFVRFDKALNELVTAPAAGDFTVLVNGSPVAVSTVNVWRTAVGGTLASAITNGNDTVTISYTPGANPLRSVDAVNIAGFTNRAATNRTDKVGGPNAGYPVVRFSPTTIRRISGTSRYSETNTQVGTFALLKFKFDTAPAAITRLFGENSGSSAFQVLFHPNRTLEIFARNTSLTTVLRWPIGPLTAGVTYDILLSFDMSQAAGASLFINGVSTGGGTVFTTGSTIGWSFANTSIGVNNNTGTGFDIGAIYLNTDTRVDLTNAANRAKFTNLTAGNLDILTRGNGITGSIPQIFLVGNADQWNDAVGINRGTGPKFFATSGLVSQVSGSEWV